MLIKKSNIALAVGVICAGFSANTFAAALDRSGQSIAAFLQPGNYAEISGSSLHPDVSGKDTSGNSTGDMANSYNFWGAAIKIQPHELISLGLIFDEPYGADATYKGDSNFTAKATDPLLPGFPLTTGMIGVNNSTSTTVEVDSRNLSAIVGIHPVKNLNLYGGAVYQEVEGSLKLRGRVYSAYNGYDANIKKDSAFGWLAGVAYEIPEIALKASVTYRSEIEHTTTANEKISIISALQDPNVLAGLGGAIGNLPPAMQATAAQILGLVGTINTKDKSSFKITTPQSVNLDFQTGIMADTVAFANVRWVEWSKFAIRPTVFGNVAQAVGKLPQVNKPNGFNVVDYSEDQWSANLGVGRKLTDTIGGSVSVGWDSGAGNPVTTLGPTEGYWNVGLGLRYSPAPQVELSGGIKYFWLGDAKAETGAHTAAGEFDSNDALAFGMKLGYRF